MNNWHEMGKIIQKYIRPATFPLAVRIVQDAAESQNEFKRPPTPNFLCQNMTMSRRYGWTIHVLPKDCTCIPARAAWGPATTASSNPSKTGSRVLSSWATGTGCGEWHRTTNSCFPYPPRNLRTW